MATSVSAILQDTSRVGIGTTAPDAPLCFAGTVGEKISLYGTNNNYRFGLGVQRLGVTTSFNTILYGPNYSNAGVQIGTINQNDGTTFNPTLNILGTGNVGVGTSTPQAKLDVVGDVRASSFRTGSLPVFGANAFVHFNGGRDINGNASTANTERRIYAGGNVSSVVRNATGQYTINFATAMTITEYMAVCSARHHDGTTFDVHCEISDRLTSSCLLNVAGNSGSAPAVNYDPRDVDVMIIC